MASKRWASGSLNALPSSTPLLISTTRHKKPGAG
jgi:hypothetical protein